MKIIIQAGGMGSRMKNLVRLKPKSLVPAMYMPIIFHLFEKYKRDEFIIVGDYQFDVLDRYLQTFAAGVNYILIRSDKKGNAAGLKEAVTFIPPDEPFMIIWSDIILAEQFSVREIKEGCQVGIADFPCSWSLVNNELVNEEISGAGVAGLYVFDNKAWFDDFPEEGSFTNWLAGKNIPRNPISLMGSIDVGTLEAHNRISPNVARCRPYNKIEFIDGHVVKTGLTAEAEMFIEREVEWYRRLSSHGFPYIPEIVSERPLTMELIAGENLFTAKRSDQEKKSIITKMVAAISNLHTLERQPASPWDLYTEYLTKTLRRLQSIASAIPLAFEKTIRINGVDCINVNRAPHRLRRAVLGHLMETHYGPIHGDCQFTNTLISSSNDIRFIDPRGYFGQTTVLGDVRYDWVKMYYSISGNFDQFNVKNFELDIRHDGVEFSIKSGGWEHLTDYFLASLPVGESDLKQIKLIHAIVWLSLASHAWEDFDSMCLAFYNGTLLFHESLEGHTDVR